MIPICFCGHSLYSHEGDGSECIGCADDGQPGYCEGFALYGFEDEKGDLIELRERVG